MHGQTARWRAYPSSAVVFATAEPAGAVVGSRKVTTFDRDSAPDPGSCWTLAVDDMLSITQVGVDNLQLASLTEEARQLVPSPLDPEEIEGELLGGWIGSDEDPASRSQGSMLEYRSDSIRIKLQRRLNPSVFTGFQAFVSATRSGVAITGTASGVIAVGLACDTNNFAPPSIGHSYARYARAIAAASPTSTASCPTGRCSDCVGCATPPRPKNGALRSSEPATRITKTRSCPPDPWAAHPKTPSTPPAASTSQTPPPGPEPPTNSLPPPPAEEY
jgi:hypothetical protein